MGLVLMYSMNDSVTSTEIYTTGGNGKMSQLWVMFLYLCVCETFVWRVRERALCICTHILDVIEAQRSSFPTVLQRLCGEGFVVTMEEAEEPTDDA